METISLEYVDIFDENKTKKLLFSKHLLKESFNKNSLFANIVDGKSMQPLINDRAVIISDISNKNLINNGVYLVYYKDKMWVKKYDQMGELFYSVNPEFSHLVYHKNDTHIVGKVLLTFTTL